MSPRGHEGELILGRARGRAKKQSGWTDLEHADLFPLIFIWPLMTKSNKLVYGWADAIISLPIFKRSRSRFDIVFFSACLGIASFGRTGAIMIGATACISNGTAGNNGNDEFSAASVGGLDSGGGKGGGTVGGGTPSSSSSSSSSSMTKFSG